MPPLDEIQLGELQKYIITNQVKLVIPTRDAELKWWAERKSDLGTYVMVSDVECLENCFDKLLFAEVCKANGLPCITTATSMEELEESSTFVVRDRYGAGSRHVYIDVSKESALMVSKVLFHTCKISLSNC